MKGSHNTFSYLPPSRWWMRPLALAARCQKRRLSEQTGRGVRALDIRVRFDRSGRPCFAHGLVTFRHEDFYGLLHAAVTDPGVAAVRVIHETLSAKEATRNDRLFRSLCIHIQAYAKAFGKPDLVLLGGRRKHDWESVYDFDARHADCTAWTDADIAQPVGSMSGSLLGKLWPWLWQRLHRRDIHAAMLDDTPERVTFIDFA